MFSDRLCEIFKFINFMSLLFASEEVEYRQKEKLFEIL